MKPLLSAFIALVLAGCCGPTVSLPRLASLKTGMTTKEVEKALHTLPPRVAALRDGGDTREVRQVPCGDAKYPVSLYFTNEPVVSAGRPVRAPEQRLHELSIRTKLDRVGHSAPEAFNGPGGIAPTDFQAAGSHS